jgi:hypothetical protein
MIPLQKKWKRPCVFDQKMTHKWFISVGGAVVREKVLPVTVVIKLCLGSQNLALMVLLFLQNAPGHLQDLCLTYLNTAVDYLTPKLHSCSHPSPQYLG